MHADCIEKLKTLRKSVSEDLSMYNNQASDLAKNGVFKIPGTLGIEQASIRKTLMIPTTLRRCLGGLDSLLQAAATQDSTAILVKLSNLFLESPKAEKNKKPMASPTINVLFADNIAVLSRTKLEANQTSFNYDKSSNTLYIACLSKKTLEHLDDLCEALAQDAKPVEDESESYDSSPSTATVPNAGISAH